MFAHAVDGQIFFPHCWFHKHNEIEDDQAATLLAVFFDSRTHAIAWSVVSGVLGLALVAYGLLGPGGLLAGGATKVAPAVAAAPAAEKKDPSY